MCRAADAAMAMVNQSIELVRVSGDEAYYMDFVKLHKLLYLAQCSMLARYGQTMFDEKITARQCGPYVDGIHFVPRRRGFDRIECPFNDQDYVRPSYWRMRIIRQVLEEYGMLDTDNLIECTKETYAYLQLKDDIGEHHWPEITPDLMCLSAIQSVS